MLLKINLSNQGNFFFNSITVFFSHAGYLLNITLPLVEFPVAGLDRAKIRLSSISSDIDVTCTF